MKVRENTGFMKKEKELKFNERRCNNNHLVIIQSLANVIDPSLFFFYFHLNLYINIYMLNIVYYLGYFCNFFHDFKSVGTHNWSKV